MIYNAGQLIQNIIKKIENNKEKKLTGIPSGFDNIDQLTLGWQPSDLIILGGRPSMGKKAFALSMIRNMAIDYNIPVAIFSLELTAKQLMSRMISIETDLFCSRLSKEKLKQEELERLKKMTIPLSEAPIYIDDSSSLTISELKKKAFHLIIHHNVKFIVVDYLQLLTINTKSKHYKSREEELTTISRKLKVLAMDLNIPIFVLSQVSEEVDERENKRPISSDIFGSRDIEISADIVSFIYRPEYYGIYEWDDDERERADGEAEFIIDKNNLGPIDSVRLRFISRIGLFKIKSKNDRVWTPIKKE